MGRAGCIRSNIMQAHTGLDALDPFDPLPPLLLHDAHARRDTSVYVCVYIYIYGMERVRAVSLSLSLSLSPRVFAIRVYTPLP